jgi:hypothetical protein
MRHPLRSRFAWKISLSSKHALAHLSFFEIGGEEKRERRARPSSHPHVGLLKPIEKYSFGFASGWVNIFDLISDMGM